MNNAYFLRISATFAAAGFIAAVILAVLYVLKLPIFDRVGIAWLLVYAMVLAGLALFALIARSIWDQGP